MNTWFNAWFVTVLTDIETLNDNQMTYGYYLDKKNAVKSLHENITDQRTWGYYLDKEDAIRSLHRNVTDMHENTYDYAVIECIGEGVIAYATERQWFKWNEELKGYYEIDEPDCVKNIVNFALG